MTVNLETLRKQLEYVARTTMCGSCGHALNRHWESSVLIHDRNGNRRYCVVDGCTCIPSWAEDEVESD